MDAPEIVQRVIDGLQASGIPYMIVGSFSSNVWGLARSTKDADFVLELKDTPIDQLTKNLGPEFTLEPQMSFETITGTYRYRLRHSATTFLIELFLLGSDPHDLKRFERRKRGELPTGSVYLPTPEDVIITKLRWSKQGQRSKDIDDVIGVLQVQSGALDLAYIRHWTDQHVTRDLFEKLLTETAT